LTRRRGAAWFGHPIIRYSHDVDALLTLPAPSLSNTARRRAVLDRLLAADRLPTPPAVAMQIVKETSSPDVTVARIGELLRQDPAICAQVLKAINSCVYALPEAVASVERAVLLLGLNTVRGLVLTLSLPAMQLPGVPDRAFRDFWQSAVSGAVIGRELAVRLKVPTAEDEMLAGLLRDIGLLLLHQSYPAGFADFARGMAERPFSGWCEYEREVFGVDHAEVSAELLARWHLPESLVQPIRHHHRPPGLSATRELLERCERLGFVDALTNLDVVAHHPAEVDALLAAARDRYGLSQTELVEFLQGAVPKVEAFTALLSIDVGACPNYAATLARGSTELFKLTMESGSLGVAATVRTPAPAHALDAGDFQPAESAAPAPPGPSTPDFDLKFLDAFPAGGCQLDGYRVQRVLGRGAMGVVFEGHDPSLDRRVAIKMMLPELADDEQNRRRFIREARNVAAIRHENVVAVYAVREGTPTYLSMEFVDGRSLEDRIEAGPPLTADELRTLAVQVAGGLAAAHARTIVHRDVKPENILLDRVTGQAKLTDFGLARAETDVSLTADGSLVGTPLYMSPEQARGQPAGPRSDLFSLGGVLYTAATGRPPFAGQAIFQVLKLVCEADPVPPTRLRPDLPPWVDAVVLKLLAKSETDRYQSADEVVEAIRGLTAAPVPVARPRGWRRFFGAG
jgi:HD-like signal output (HDOD) protein/tRNA A-37 threonylcarbamoyl transferase component Bud32